MSPRLMALVALLVASTLCATEPTTPAAPYVLILGTAQDGGLPQIGCSGDHCQRAQSEAAFRRLVTCLAVVDPQSGKRWLFEATPDLPDQVARLAQHPTTRHMPKGKRGPLFDGIFLTHAHMGHYSGLVHLGREAYGHPEIPVFGSQRMADFLTNHGPWSLLVKAKHIKPVVLVPNEGQSLMPSIKVTPLLVPHRDEFTDTFGYVIQGPSRKILFIPDIDKWSKWDRSMIELLGEVDVALLDGTFFADGEIPGRAMAEIPHPFIKESMALFQNLPLQERQKVVFIHFNHTNPVVDRESSATKEVRALGMSIADEMQKLEL